MSSLSKDSSSSILARYTAVGLIAAMLAACGGGGGSPGATGRRRRRYRYWHRHRHRHRHWRRR